MTDSLADILSYFSEKQLIRQLDYQFAMFIARQCSQDQSEVAWLCAVVSFELGHGHICIPIYDTEGRLNDTWLYFGLSTDESLRFRSHVESVDWPGVIRRCPFIGSSEDNCPLVFDGQRLYLHRYWYYEAKLAERLRQLSAPVHLDTEDIELLTAQLQQLFSRNYRAMWHQLSGSESQEQLQQRLCDLLDITSPDTPDWAVIHQRVRQAAHPDDLTMLDELIPDRVCLNWQKTAAATALTRQFTVISGGPGTGKTTTVTRLLAALVVQAQAHQIAPLIRLVAPTGKAAARLTESIGQAIEKLPVSPEIKALLPVQASTLHRLLGVRPGSAEFLHHEQNLLHVDILVVDEASMVDLPMMYKLLMALPLHTRVILLGDKDQLASVEAGAVLGDICSFQSCGFSREQTRLLERLTGNSLPVPVREQIPDIANGLCTLKKSYRFHADSGIGFLAALVNSGEYRPFHEIDDMGYSDIEVRTLDGGHYNHMLNTLVEAYSRYLSELHSALAEEHLTAEHTAKRVLTLFNQCRLLCALREGDFGVSGLNQKIESLLQRRGMIQKDQEVWYNGRPVMVTKNDHTLGIYNGDIGICLLTMESGREVFKIYFEQFDGNVKGVIPSRLPEHETAYAMTIHKSQGSEFDFTLMVLPPEFNPVLSRELIYTGITRAKNKLNIYADPVVFRRAIRTRTQRLSGLVAQLTGAE
ncbi:RecBCD enzyme subunit RecD [Vibrio aerogenes CECT 7868]|uniref:RecBCD enzyme subunit RecD n=1 Tax=Vibrio aerogenes CECT 7868 TaxID=1216006 RepID=A0A1M5WL82_9VIBR|nr:exodeoxyribonuclease V subunit alpha [Vibrio aerogenes]SHH88295.1 RecBCD enzyme subunit RecD [Vibrio aerogenes CECT 7868]